MEECANFLPAPVTTKSHNNDCAICTWWLPTAGQCAFKEDTAGFIPPKYSNRFNPTAASEFLKTKGILPHLKGYYYLLTTMEELSRLPYNSILPRELFREVAKRCATSTTVIERSINGAIKSAWLKGGLQEHWNKPPTPRLLIESMVKAIYKET